MGDPCSHRYYRANMHFSPEVVGDPSLRLLRGDWNPTNAVRLTRDSGASDPVDVIWTTLALPLLVSQRVIDLLEANAFTGWCTFPVVVQNGTKAIVPGYHGLAITGRCGPLEGSRSRVVLRDYPAMLVEERVGYRFDEASWDGSDLFCSTDGSAIIVCTAAVKGALERAKVRNLKFTCLSDLTIYDEAILKTLPPLARIPKIPGVKQRY